MVYSRTEVVKRALASNTNEPGYCQWWTRDIIGVESAGDFDGDGAADAEDGWKKEPEKYKHRGDRNPPGGVPVSWTGGSNDNGHRAVSLGGGKIRSTDAGGKGKVATVDLEWVEQNWGLRYEGWSETMNGVLIPGGEDDEKVPDSEWAKGDVWLFKLRKGQYDSDSVRRMQFRLRHARAGASPNLPITGNYLSSTAEAVRKWQAEEGVDFGPNSGDFMGPLQAERLFGPNYTLRHLN